MSTDATANQVILWNLTPHIDAGLATGKGRNEAEDEYGRDRARVEAANERATLNEQRDLIQPVAAVHRLRSLKVVTGMVVGAGLLLAVVGCTSGGDATPPPGTDSGQEAGTADIGSTVESMKVCDLVDFQPLLDTLQAGFESGPDDVGPGFGVDPGGAQCPAQFDLPAIRSSLNSEPDGSLTASINIAVVPYSGVDVAAESFDARAAEVGGFTGAETENLDGAWSRAILVMAGNEFESKIYALAQQDSHLVKFDFQMQNDESFDEKFPFTTDDVASTIVAMMGDLDARVTTEIDGQSK